MNRGITAVGRLALALGTAALLVVGAACGSDASDNGNPSSASASAATVDAAGHITVVAKDNSYTPKEISTKAGQKTTVTLENKGAALHNLQIKDMKGPDGKDVQTELLPGGQTGTIEFTLNPGMYEFFCSVHPVEMRGTIKAA